MTILKEIYYSTYLPNDINCICNIVNGFTRLTFPIIKQDTLNVQCELCKGAVNVNCLFVL